MDWFDIGAKAVDVIGNQVNAAVEYNRTKKLMDIQQANQMELNRQGQQIQLETWEKTNYPAQVGMLKKAGLNPGLLYGKGGSGGVTGGQSGGSAAMGSAPRVAPMDIMNSLALSKVKADIENVKADTEKKKTETGVIGGVGVQEAESRIAKLIAETQNEQLKGELIRLQTGIAQIQMSNEQSQIDAHLKNVAEQTRKLELENKITKETTAALIAEAGAKATGAALENALTREQIKLTAEQKQAIGTSLQQKWTELTNQAIGLQQKDKEILINKFKAELEAEFMGAGKVVGKVFKNVVDFLDQQEAAQIGEVYQDRVKF